MTTRPKAAEPIRPVYEVLRRLSGGALGITENLTVDGIENIPSTGPAIVAPNHLSVHDSTVLMGVLPRMVRWIGKAEYLDNPLTRLVVRGMGMIPVDRTDSASGTDALEAAVRVLEGGEMFGIFPEGTRTIDGRLHKGRTGVARVAIRTGAPIIPVGLVGVEQMQTIDDPLWVWRPGKDITVRIGEPIDPSRYAARSNQTLSPRQLTDDVMFEIAQLSGQQYVDEYTLRPAERERAERDGSGTAAT